MLLAGATLTALGPINDRIGAYVNEFSSGDYRTYEILRPLLNAEDYPDEKVIITTP